MASAGPAAGRGAIIATAPAGSGMRKVPDATNLRRLVSMSEMEPVPPALIALDKLLYVTSHERSRGARPPQVDVLPAQRHDLAARRPAYRAVAHTGRSPSGRAASLSESGYVGTPSYITLVVPSASGPSTMQEWRVIQPMSAKHHYVSSGWMSW